MVVQVYRSYDYRPNWTPLRPDSHGTGRIFYRLKIRAFRLHSHGTGRIVDRLKNWPFTLFARNRIIFLLCSHGIDVLDEILTFVSGLTSCSCAEGYFQDPKCRQERERLTIAAMRTKIRHLKALKEINILHGRMKKRLYYWKLRYRTKQRKRPREKTGSQWKQGPIDSYFFFNTNRWSHICRLL